MENGDGAVFFFIALLSFTGSFERVDTIKGTSVLWDVAPFTGTFYIVFLINYLKIFIFFTGLNLKRDHAFAMKLPQWLFRSKIVWYDITFTIHLYCNPQ